MAGGKRASMREGPLAALFQRTDVEPADGQPKAPDIEAEERAARAREAEAAAEREREERRAQEARSLRDDEERAERRRNLSPKDRLSAAFAQDIPHDILARPDATERDWRPRDEPDIRRPATALGPVLKVAGIGGAGVNAVNRMIEAGVEGVEFIAVNTDLQSLQQSSADVTLHIGSDITRGLGSGSDPTVGRASAISDDDRIKTLLKGSDMVFVAAGSGGGTGTGGAPVVARIAQEIGALTVGIVTKPFGF